MHDDASAGGTTASRMGATAGTRRAVALAGVALLALAAGGAGAQQPAAPGTVTFVGAATSPIAASVLIPANRASMWISGTTPPLLKADAPAGSRDRYGDTETQATGALAAIAAQLAAQGLSMRDVVYVRAFLVPDPAKAHRIDTAGWNAAYTRVFGTTANPNKTARSTVGVTQLVNPDFLIELEAFAVYPAPK